jgi:hypothetical protein
MASFFKVEGSNHEFLMAKLELAHTLYIGVFSHSFIGGKNGIFIKMWV